MIKAGSSQKNGGTCGCQMLQSVWCRRGPHSR